MATKDSESKWNWAGVDEAGRGPLAGPVVAAAVVVPNGFRCKGLTDSKKMTPQARKAAAERIMRECVWAIAVADVVEIDRDNILRATMSAMRRAIERLDGEFDGVLVDGNVAPDAVQFPIECHVSGDARFIQISAASVIAKTYRDELMVAMARKYPQYGFERHFGYATPEHLAALREHGPCEIHRRSFAPVYAILNQPCLALDE